MSCMGHCYLIHPCLLATYCIHDFIDRISAIGHDWNNSRVGFFGSIYIKSDLCIADSLFLMST